MPDAPLIFQGGQAVSPEEVEQVLLAHPAVAEAAVIGVPDPLGDEIVAVAVRLSAPLPSAAADLAAYCRARLASYKVPVRWLFTGALPRTRTGGACRATLTAQLSVEVRLGRPAGLPAGQRNGRQPAPLPGVPRPRLAAGPVRIPPQVRRSAPLEDLDQF